MKFCRLLTKGPRFLLKETQHLKKAAGEAGLQVHLHGWGQLRGRQVALAQHFCDVVTRYYFRLQARCRLVGVHS